MLKFNCLTIFCYFSKMYMVDIEVTWNIYSDVHTLRWSTSRPGVATKILIPFLNLNKRWLKNVVAWWLFSWGIVQIMKYLAFSDFRFSPPVTEPGTIQINGFKFTHKLLFIDIVALKSKTKHALAFYMLSMHTLILPNSCKLRRFKLRRFKLRRFKLGRLK